MCWWNTGPYHYRLCSEQFDSCIIWVCVSVCMRLCKFTNLRHFVKNLLLSYMHSSASLAHYSLQLKCLCVSLIRRIVK